MKLPTHIAETIGNLKSHGDIAKIAEASGFHYLTISRAIRSGNASPDVIEAICQFYAERLELLNQFQN